LLAHLAISDDGDTIAGADELLLDDAEGGGEGLGESRVLARHRIGHHSQVGRGERQLLAVSAVFPEDAQDCAGWAVVASAVSAAGACGADVAATACQVDLAHHALANQVLMPCGRLFTHADKLVAHDAGEAHVALHDLEVGITDASDEHPHHALTYTRARHCHVLQLRRIALNHERLHRRHVAARSFQIPLVLHTFSTLPRSIFTVPISVGSS
jgi:hypothetical protein